MEQLVGAVGEQLRWLGDGGGLCGGRAPEPAGARRGGEGRALLAAQQANPLRQPRKLTTATATALLLVSQPPTSPAPQVQAALHANQTVKLPWRCVRAGVLFVQACVRKHVRARAIGSRGQCLLPVTRMPQPEGATAPPLPGRQQWVLLRRMACMRLCTIYGPLAPCTCNHLLRHWRAVLHIPPAAHMPPACMHARRWTDCSRNVKYSRADLLSSMLPTYERLLQVQGAGVGSTAAVRGRYGGGTEAHRQQARTARQFLDAGRLPGSAQRVTRAGRCCRHWMYGGGDIMASSWLMAARKDRPQAADIRMLVRTPGS